MEPVPNNDMEKMILQRAAGLQPPFETGAEEAWPGLVDRIENHNSKEIQHKSYHLWPIAAGFLLFVALAGLIYLLAEVSISTPNSSRLATTLPDGSTVVLHANSRVKFNRIKWLFAKEVHLEGEGWFEVTPGEQFSVLTSPGTVQVLGTTFDVLATDSSLRVYCETGKVEVSTSRNAVRIGPGEMAIGNDSSLEMSPIEYKPNFWLKDEIIFENAPIGMVILHLEREYNIIIKHKFDPDRRFSGTLPDKSMADALEILCAPFGTHWSQTQKDGQTVITIE